MVNKHRVTFNSNKGNAFIVHCSKGPIRFSKIDQNLYVWKPPQYKPTVTGKQMVETIKGNKSFFTDRQVQRAKEARKLLQALGYPTVQDLKALIQMNTIQNCPVTGEDVDLAQKIFGPDIASVKGKTTRQKPTPVRTHVVQLPPELKTTQRDAALCIDTLHVNGMPFLGTITRRIMY